MHMKTLRLTVYKTIPAWLLYLTRARHSQEETNSNEEMIYWILKVNLYWFVSECNAIFKLNIVTQYTTKLANMSTQNPANKLRVKRLRNKMENTKNIVSKVFELAGQFDSTSSISFLKCLKLECFRIPGMQLLSRRLQTKPNHMNFVDSQLALLKMRAWPLHTSSKYTFLNRLILLYYF